MEYGATYKVISSFYVLNYWHFSSFSPLKLLLVSSSPLLNDKALKDICEIKFFIKLGEDAKDELEGGKKDSGGLILLWGFLIPDKQSCITNVLCCCCIRSDILNLTEESVCVSKCKPKRLSFNKTSCSRETV